MVKAAGGRYNGRQMAVISFGAWDSENAVGLAPSDRPHPPQVTDEGGTGERTALCFTLSCHKCHTARLAVI